MQVYARQVRCLFCGCEGAQLEGHSFNCCVGRKQQPEMCEEDLSCRQYMHVSFNHLSMPACASSPLRHAEEAAPENAAVPPTLLMPSIECHGTATYQAGVLSMKCVCSMHHLSAHMHSWLHCDTAATCHPHQHRPESTAECIYTFPGSLSLQSIHFDRHSICFALSHAGSADLG